MKEEVIKRFFQSVIGMMRKKNEGKIKWNEENEKWKKGKEKKEDTGKEVSVRKNKSS